FGLMCTAGFPEPLTYSWRVRRELAGRRGEFDLIHDNQCLGRGLLRLMQDGWPLVATLHHPITVDRDLDLAHATTIRRKLTLRRRAHEGAGAPAGGGGQSPHRAALPPGRDRPAAGGEPGPRHHRAAGTGGRGPVRARRERRAGGRAVRRGRGGGGAVAVRGVL